MKLALLIVAVSVTALAAATFVHAKESARAQLTTSLPLGATPRAMIRAQWRVDTRDDKGDRRPFGANGMFVRLLSRTGAAATIGFARGTRHADGRYSAKVRVPSGGIGGIRMGLRGWNNRGTADLIFPLENDPFTSPAGLRCDVTAVRSTLAAFVRAYNRGAVRRLDRLFSREGFVWYFATGPSRELRGAKQNRRTLIAYFRERHRRGERLTLLNYRFNGYERARDLGHFQLDGRRRADDFRDGRFEMVGKGALDCSRSPVTIALLLVGG